jgi:hypothetical protein
VNSGIATTITASLRAGVDPAAVGTALESAYASASFVRLLGQGGCADTKNVTRTNFIDIGWTHDPRTGPPRGRRRPLSEAAAGQHQRPHHAQASGPEPEVAPLHTHQTRTTPRR